MSLHPASTVDPATTIILVWGVCGIGLGALAAFCLAMARRHRRIAVRTVSIEGEVVADAPPIVVKILLEGRESKGRNGWGHTWTETSRHVTGRPFHIRTDGGMVRVDADDKVFLAHSKDLRPEGRPSWTITLQPGEKVFVSGEETVGPDEHGEGTGYRKAAEARILRAPVGGKLAVSSFRIDVLRRDTARRWRVAGIAYAIMLAVAQLVFLKTNALAIAGHVETRTIVSKNRYETHGKRGTTTHYIIELDRGGSQEVARTDWSPLGPGRQVPLLVAGPFEQLGVHACASVNASISIGLILVIMLWLPLVGAFAHRPWWETKVYEVRSGRLPNTA